MCMYGVFCMCDMCMHACIHVHAFGRQRRNSGCPSVSLCLPLWHSLTVSVRLASELPEFAHLHFSMLGLQTCAVMPGLYMDAWDLNSGPHAHTASALPH